MYFEANATAYNQNPKAFLRFEEIWWNKIKKENTGARKEDYVYCGNTLGFKKI